MLSTKHIVELLDTFQLQGPNGIHHCLVFELLGPSLESTQQAYIEFNNYGHYIEFDNTDFKELTNYLGIECPRVLRIVTALFVALKFMHTWGICHGGISAANIAYTYGGRQHHVTDDKIFEAMGLPQVVPLERCDRMPLSEGLPKELVQSAQWNGYLEEAEFDIRLIGFGKSSLYGQESDKVKQAVHLRCPETIMGGKHLYHTDLWHAGCFVTPPDEHDHQLQDLSDISQGPQQVLPEVAAVTPGSLISHESQQPQASEPFQSAKTTQSEASEIPDNSKEPQLDLTEDTAASSDDSETKPGSRKRLRSRLGGLLNHKWRPWKRRRDS
ncbi:hypothetical protein PENVUL_c039G07836 [Penicillium vulpinum]|uniref:Protein kinase domain-containing protein n=2 Tax=Penicillium vulpinum TaxID=29845 RepID=A0A1V6RMI5_9EURO|nr:hypothetical protein PENVUL_c039G07836 [Penicillium vulpinum]